MKNITCLLNFLMKKIRGTIRVLFASTVAACCLLFFAGPATALNLTVNDLGDTADANLNNATCADAGGKCTLRAAIEQINFTADASNSVLFSGGLVLPGTILLGSSLPTVTRNITIAGPGSDLLTIVVLTGNRIFNIQLASPGTVFMSGLHLTGGAPPGNGGAVNITSTATADFEKMVFEANEAPGGGAIYCMACSLLLRKDRFTGNHAISGPGGAISATANSTIDIRDTTFDGNTTSGGGGAVYAIGSDVTVLTSRFEGNSAGNGGGGLWASLAAGDKLFCWDTTFSGNSAGSFSGGGIVLDGSGTSAIFQNVTVSGNRTDNEGGGLYISSSTSYTVVANSTFSGNRAAMSGGGIRHSGSGTLALSNVTITGNEAGWTLVGDAGGGIGKGSSPATIENSVVAGNAALNSGAAHPHDCEGSFTSGGYNIIGDATNCFLSSASGDQTGNAATPLDPLLSVLAWNGGNTPTHGLQAASPAADRGNVGGCTWDDNADGGAEVALPEDQRTALRPYGVRCDVGAFEWSHCDNGVMDSDESGADCGGTLCAACSCPGTDSKVLTAAYSTIQDAYDATWDDAVIRARETNTSQHPVFDRAMYVTLRGGHDCDFFRIRGMTTVASLTVSAGRLTVENIAIGP
jgi:predicted outer membrane repeat protein